MGFFNSGTGLDAHQLRDESVHHIAVVLRLKGFHIGHEAEFEHLGVGQIVEAKEVGTGLLDGAAVGAE